MRRTEVLSRYWIVYAVPISVEVLQKQSPERQKIMSVLVTSDSFFFLHIILKMVQTCLIFALMNALYLNGSVWIYASIHRCSNDVIRLQHSFITFPRRHHAIQSTRVISHKIFWHRWKRHKTQSDMQKKTLGEMVEYQVWYGRKLSRSNNSWH